MKGMEKIATTAANKAVVNHVKKLHKFAKGGKTNANMKKLGRGLAKVANQKSSSKSRGR